MKYLLVILLAGADEPQIYGKWYDTRIACYEAGFVAQIDQNERLIWWTCEEMPEQLEKWQQGEDD